MNTSQKQDQPCRIVGISGSLRAGSYTTLTVKLALKGAEELKCETKLIDLRDYQLLFCDGKDDESQYPKDAFRLREEVKQAQGIIPARLNIMADTVASSERPRPDGFRGV